MRFVNRITMNKFKLIGFEIENQKNLTYEIMLQCITDFTLPKSKVNLFYKD